MEHEREKHLHTAAYIARANLLHHLQKPQQQRNKEEAGATVFMSRFLGIYKH